MKTVKELVESIGVSKVSLYSMLKKPEFKGHTFKGENNVTLIDDIGVELLKAYYLKEQGEQFKNIVNDELSQEQSEPSDTEGGKVENKEALLLNNHDIIRVLQEQLSAKDKQIDNLLSIVLNQQKLQGVQLISENQNTMAADEVQPPELPKKKGLWGIFKK